MIFSVESSDSLVGCKAISARPFSLLSVIVIVKIVIVKVILIV